MENLNDNSVYKKFTISGNEDMMNSLSQCFQKSGYNFISTEEFSNSYTSAHSSRVSAFSVLIGEKLGLSDEDLNYLRLGGLFHDVGKFGIPTDIINKDSKLTDLEFNRMKTHTLIGTDILSSSNIFKNILPIVEHHHEKYDGNGYPSNLKGEEIPYLARIVAVADSFDAMTSKRTYNIPMTLDEAKEEIRRCSGTQFDPSIAQVFIDILDNNSDEIIQIQNRF